MIESFVADSSNVPPPPIPRHQLVGTNGVSEGDSAPPPPQRNASAKPTNSRSSTGMCALNSSNIAHAIYGVGRESTPTYSQT